MLVCTFLLYTASTVNITSVSGVASSMLLFDMLSLVILSDPNISSSSSIMFELYYAILFVHGVYHNCLFLPDGLVLFNGLTTIHSPFAR